jgi:hypothetical protein
MIPDQIEAGSKRIQFRRSREYYSDTGNVWSWRFNLNFSKRPDVIYCLGLDRPGRALKFVWKLTNDQAARYVYGAPWDFGSRRKRARTGTFVLRISSGFFLLNPTLETYNRWWGVSTETFRRRFREWLGTSFPLPTARPALKPHE